jgi:hypothetical protein
MFAFSELLIGIAVGFLLGLIFGGRIQRRVLSFLDD